MVELSAKTTTDHESKKRTKIGIIPHNWEVLQLGKSCQIKSSSLPFKKIESIDTKDTNNPRVMALKVSDMNSDFNQYIITKANIEFYPEPLSFNFDKCIPPKSIIFPKRGAAIATNKKRLLGNRAILDPNLIAVIPSKTFLPEFLYNYFLTLDLKNFTDPGCLPQLNKKDLEPVYLPKPPIQEQKIIAVVLSLVQNAIAQQEKAIALTTELKKALMQKLFTEGTRNEAQKQTEIGRIPESWDVISLDKTGEVVYGIQASVANNIDPIGTKILTNKNITLDGEIDLSKQNYFELKTKSHQQTILKKGDILFNWRSGSKDHVGKTAYFNLEGEYVHSSFILRIRPLSEKEGDLYVSLCPELDLASQGATVEEAKANLTEALELFFETASTSEINVLISAFLFTKSKPRQALDKAQDIGIVLLSDAVLAELVEVLTRPKFDRYISRKIREQLTNELAQTA